MLRRYILFLKKSPIITALLAIVYIMVCIKKVDTSTNFQVFLVRTMLCGAVCFFLYQISGDKTLTSIYNSTGYVIKVSIGFLIIATLIGIVLMVMSLQGDAPISDNPVLGTLVLFLMFMAVGLFEELAFRAVINDAIIYKFRDWKYVFVLSAVVSSIAFGAAHVIGFNTSSYLAWLQAIGKTLSSGVFGLALLILYWKTRNIWACGVVHGLYDFLASFSMGIYKSPALQHTSYVASDENAIQVIILYSVLTVIEGAFALIIWKKIGKKIDFKKIRKDW
ncbi:MAG: CPBP family intramembrane metalloprotease [Oscillospiraceae bacterium]|nr:CPBP family intramembrane metalloprotease [Oscillospiraceae bacterium]